MNLKYRCNVLKKIQIRTHFKNEKCKKVRRVLILVNYKSLRSAVRFAKDQTFPGERINVGMRRQIGTFINVQIRRQPPFEHPMFKLQHVQTCIGTYTYTLLCQICRYKSFKHRHVQTSIMTTKRVVS